MNIYYSPGYTSLLLIKIGLLYRYFILKVVGRSNEHMFRFTGVDLKFVLYHPFAYIFKINIYLVDKVSAGVYTSVSSA